METPPLELEFPRAEIKRGWLIPEVIGHHRALNLRPDCVQKRLRQPHGS